MIIKVFLSISFFLALLCSCRNTGPSEEVPVISFRRTEAIDLREVLGEVRFVQLRNHPESAFTDVDKLLTCDDLIFLLDKRLKAVFCFDTTGAFRYRIQRIGRGPGEYLDLDAMWISLDTRELWLQSFRPARIFIHDLDGTLKREVSIRWPARDMVRLGPDLLAGYNSSGSNDGRDSLSPGIFLLDSGGRYKGQPLVTGDTTAYWSLVYQRHLEADREGALLLSQSDTLYRITPTGKARPEAVFDWGKLAVPKEVRQRPLRAGMASSVFDGEFIGGKDQPIKFNNYLIFRVFINGRMELALADLSARTGQLSGQLLCGGSRMPLVYPLAATSAGELAGIYDLSLLHAFRDSRSGRPDDPAHREIWMKVDAMVDQALEEDRPILWFASVNGRNTNINI